VGGGAPCCTCLCDASATRPAGVVRCEHVPTTSSTLLCPAQAVQEQPSGAAQLRALSDALRQSLAEWFSVGLLQLQRISWEGSSASLLEKASTLLALLGLQLRLPLVARHCALTWPQHTRASPHQHAPCHLSSPSALQVAAGEAVHDIVSWGDLKGRLNPDNRRCIDRLRQFCCGKILAAGQLTLSSRGI
jgi:hypothetical protein